MCITSSTVELQTVPEEIVESILEWAIRTLWTINGFTMIWKTWTIWTFLDDLEACLIPLRIKDVRNKFSYNCREGGRTGGS